MDSPRTAKKILVVEDNADLRQVIAGTLQLEGYQVLQADFAPDLCIVNRSERQ